MSSIASRVVWLLLFFSFIYFFGNAKTHEGKEECFMVWGFMAILMVWSEMIGMNENNAKKQ